MICEKLFTAFCSDRKRSTEARGCDTGHNFMTVTSCRFLACLVVLISLFLSLAACEGALPGLYNPTPTPKPVEPLILYDWGDYLPKPILGAFTERTGIRVENLAYQDYQDAAVSIQRGELYDVVILAPDQVRSLISDGRLARLEPEAIPNLQNISPDFRNMSYDPGNVYSVPLVWGSSGLLYRTDLVQKPVTHWADLWDSEYTGKVAIWPMADTMLPIALKTLGYSANEEDPAALEAAIQRLLELKPNAVVISNSETTIIPVLESGQAVIAVGWALDALTAQASNQPIEYILPEEGSILWSEELVIPANSPHKDAAEQFINFLLSAEISAQIPELMGYAVPNEAAKAIIPADILQNPIIFPSAEALKNAELLMPHSPAGKQLFDMVWQRFLDAR